MTDAVLEREPVQGGAIVPEGMVSQIWRRFARHRLAVASLVILIGLIVAAALGPLNPYDPNAQAPGDKLQAPSAEHWLGTDSRGRDLLSRLQYGGQISLAVGLLSTVLTLVIGTAIGAAGGYYGGWIDNVLMRITDAFLTFPTTFVLILISALLRELPYPQLKNSVMVVIVVIGVLSWMYTARLVRGLVLVLRERDFVTAARALGASDARIILGHILPNCLGPILVNGTLQMAFAVITESGLSYLGFGIQPPTASWGNILEEAQQHIFRAPWLAIFPGVLIFLVAMTVNYIGDGLRDGLDPYLVRGAKG